MNSLLQHLLQFLLQLWRRMLSLIRRGRLQREMEEEMRFHLDMQIEQNLEAGMATEEARQAAQRQFGNQTWLKEVSREMWSLRSIETLIQDLRYGARILIKQPSFTLIAVFTLALGIGANTAIFSLVDAVLLRPLPFQEPERLVMIWEDAARIGFPRSNSSPATYLDWKTRNLVFDDVAALVGRDFNLTGEGEPEQLDATAVTPNLFPLLGVKPLLGRSFLPEEQIENRVALLSYGLWQRRFGGDPQLVGKEILLNDRKFTVVGVMPAGFQFLGKELWVPLAFNQNEPVRRDALYLSVVARLKAGVTLRQAQDDIEAITQQIAQEDPVNAKFLRAYVLPLRDQFAGEMRKSLLVLLAAVGCVLLIACANIANLLLARAAARNKEIAMRMALGATRLRLVRQLLTESVLLAGLGGLAGLLLVYWSLAFLKQMIPTGMVLLTKIEINTQVFGYALLISLLTGLVFGLAPAWQGTKVDLNETLKRSSGRCGVGGARLRSVLVVVEFALAFVLLVGAGLLVQTFIRFQNLELGFQPENVLTIRTSLASARYGELPKRAAFYQQVLERVRALPGVIAVGYTTAAPLARKGGSNGFTIEGRPPERGRDALHRQISPDYFRAIGIGLREGRNVDERDGPQSPPVAVINETMARQFWPNENALGKRFKLGPPEEPNPWMMIVGIAKDHKQMGLEAPVKAEMYLPYAQVPYNFNYHPRDLVVRTAGDPANLIAAIKREIWAVDNAQPISNIRMMEEILQAELAQRRMGTTLMMAFAGLSLLLAGLGIYGVLSYTVAQRAHELGIRMALGARRSDVLRIVIGQGMKVTFIGVAIGLLAAFALTRLLKTLLFGVSATDLLTFLVIALVLTVVALLACWLPARRATKVDPMAALRCE